MKTNWIFLSLLFSIVLNSEAQDISEKENAFRKSYGSEYRYQYDSAMMHIKPFYDEKNYELNLRMGWLSYLSGKHDNAIMFYKRAITAMPASVEAQLGYVYPLSAKENWNEVIKQYEDILKKDPGNSVVNFRMGLIYYNRKDFLTAKKYLDKVINLYPFNYDGVHLSAWNHLNMGNYREAQQLFQKALLIKPSDASSLEGLKQIK